jgi:hypothetical protein
MIVSAAQPSITRNSPFLSRLRSKAFQNTPVGATLRGGKLCPKSFFNPFPTYINFLTILDTLAISVLIPDHAASSRPVSKLYTFFSTVFVSYLRGNCTKANELHIELTHKLLKASRFAPRKQSINLRGCLSNYLISLLRAIDAEHPVQTASYTSCRCNRYHRIHAHTSADSAASCECPSEPPLPVTMPSDSSVTPVCSIRSTQTHSQAWTTSLYYL